MVCKSFCAADVFSISLPKLCCNIVSLKPAGVTLKTFRLQPESTLDIFSIHTHFRIVFIAEIATEIYLEQGSSITPSCGMSKSISSSNIYTSSSVGIWETPWEFHARSMGGPLMLYCRGLGNYDDFSTMYEGSYEKC